MQLESENTSTTTCLPELSEVENLTSEVRRLLVHSEKTLDEEGIKAQAETLERWLESYRRGISAAQKLSKNSEPFLKEIRQRLWLALEEMQHLEDEGGPPATPEQTQRMHDLSRAIARIDRFTAALNESSLKIHEPELA